MIVDIFQEKDSAQWDAFAADCPMATFLHSRRYLSYHGDRFHDVSLIVRNEQGKTLGLLPAAVDPSDHSRVASHPGLTYGGWLHAGKLAGSAMIQAFSAAAEHFRKRGFTALRYKPVPWIYHRQPAQDDSYALFRLGAIRVRCDLSCAIDLRSPAAPNENRRRALRKARTENIELSTGLADLPDYWTLLQTTLADRHQAKPTHSLAEIDWLGQRFPENIRLTLARRNGTPIAGVLVYRTGCTDHAQYIASSEEGNRLSALDLIFSALIDKTRQDGKLFFSFGISNEDNGRILNSGLYQFKAGFGGGGVAHEFFDWHFAPDSETASLTATEHSPPELDNLKQRNNDEN